MRRGIWIGLVVLVVCALFGSPTMAQSCAPTCTCQASYNGGICKAECGPCPSGMCAKCTCSSETGCVFGCFLKPGGGGGSGNGCKGEHCVMWLEADALTVTGLVEFIRPHFPAGWTVAVVGDDDGTRATFSGEWTLEDILRLHYGRRLEMDQGRMTAKIAK